SSGLRGFPWFANPIIPLNNPAELSAWMLEGSIVTYPQPAANNCSVDGKSPSGSGSKKLGGGNRVTGLYAGYLSNISFIFGSCLTIISLKAAFSASISLGEGCAGAGKEGRPNIISTGTGPFTFVGTTSIISIFTLMAG